MIFKKLVLQALESIRIRFLQKKTVLDPDSIRTRFHYGFMVWIGRRK